MFIDEAKIYLRSGDGGNGCSSFRREKFIEFGGPDGGNGGRGGDIIFKASNEINSLLDFRYKQHYKASKGGNGSGSNRTGHSASPTIIKVPLGTQILSEDNYLIQDMSENNKEFLYLSGGNGGLGNAHFKTSVTQAPTRSTKGKVGTESWVWLKLKLISDVGVIGLPNAGKSSFISKVTASRPKIADYPFTTLSPNLGVASIDQDTIIIADIPGLIKNAHLGVGLGIKFLKHIERCSIILHLIDINSENIIKDYLTIRNELENYSEKLVNKREIIALSKVDYPDDVTKSIIEEVKEKLQKEIFYISSTTNLNMTEILRECKNIINELKTAK